MDKRIMLVGILTIVLIGLPALGLTGAVFSNAQIQAISYVESSPLAGTPAVLISLLAGSGADGLTASISRNIDSDYNTDNSLFLAVAKTKDRIVYTGSERTTEQGFHYYELKNSCSGVFSCPNLDTFTADCKSGVGNSNNFVASTGDIINPKYSCYYYKPKWIITDFDRTTVNYQPVIDIYTEFNSGMVAGVELTASNPRDYIKTTTGTIIGEGSIGAISSSLTSPPDESSIKALRDTMEYFPAGTYHLVDSGVESAYSSIYSRFNTCQTNAKRSSSITFGLSLYGLSFGIPIYADYDETKLNSCFNTLKDEVNALRYVKPVASWQNVDSSKLTTQRTISLVDSYNIPNVQIWLYADSIGVVRPEANPSNLVCQNKDMQGGTTGSISCSVGNTGESGIIYWTATCTAPTSVITGSGSLYSQKSQTSDFGVLISTGSTASTSTCTITAKSASLAKQISTTSRISSTEVCNKVATLPFIVDENCNSVCPLQASDCSAGQTFNPTLCKCEGTVPPTCTPPAIYDSASNACIIPKNDSSVPSCMSIVQKLKTIDSTECKSYLFGVCTEYKKIYSCETDYMGAIFVIVGFAGLGWFAKQQRWF